MKNKIFLSLCIYIFGLYCSEQLPNTETIFNESIKVKLYYLLSQCAYVCATFIVFHAIKKNNIISFLKKLYYVSLSSVILFSIYYIFETNLIKIDNTVVVSLIAFVSILFIYSQICYLLMIIIFLGYLYKIKKQS